MKGDNVVDLHDYFAACPECNGQEFRLRVNAPGNAWSEITGTECAKCHAFVVWRVLNLRAEENQS